VVTLAIALSKWYDLQKLMNKLMNFILLVSDQQFRGSYFKTRQHISLSELVTFDLRRTLALLFRSWSFKFFFRLAGHVSCFCCREIKSFAYQQPIEPDDIGCPCHKSNKNKNFLSLQTEKAKNIRRFYRVLMFL